MPKPIDKRGDQVPFLIVLILSPKAYAIFDFIGTQVKKGAELGSYADSVKSLSDELNSNSDLDIGLRNIRDRSSRLSAELKNMNDISDSSKNILRGPDWSKNRLDENIRATSDYVSRFKRMVIKIAALGTEGAIALNTTETNVALNEMQKNQQALILQNEDEKLRKLENEIEEKKSWQNFVSNQKAARNRGK